MPDRLELDYLHLSLVPPEVDWQRPVATVPDGREGLYSSMARPMVMLKLTGPDGASVYEWGIIDTGADATSMPPRLMAPLGIAASMCDPEPACVHGGISPCPRFTEGVELTVAGTWKLRVRPHFIPAFKFVLLGQEDFCAAFKIGLDRRARKLTLEAHQDVERLPDPWQVVPTPAEVAA
jgi:hypothetical protein